MINYYETGRKIGYNAAKLGDWIDKKLHLFHHGMAKGTDRMGIERKFVGESLRATGLLILPFVFSDVVDKQISSVFISDSVKEIANTLDYIEKIHPLANMGLYIRGIECMLGGAITASVASFKGSDLFYEIGLATLAAGASLTCWASANYIERKKEN